MDFSRVWVITGMGYHRVNCLLQFKRPTRSYAKEYENKVKFAKRWEVMLVPYRLGCPPGQVQHSALE